MNPSRILAAACAVVAALLPTSLLAQWNNSGTQLAPVPPISTVSPTTGSGPVVTYQPGSQFGTPPTVTGPPANSAPVITSQPGTQNVQPGTQFSQPGVQYGQPGMQYGQPGMQYGQPGTGAPVITGPQASQSMPPPPNTFGGATHDPYYQPLPGTASPPPAALGTPMLPGGMNWGTFGSVAGITPRAGGGTRIGEDVGLDEGFTWMQGFVPVF